MVVPPNPIVFLTILFVLLVWYFWYLNPKEKQEQKDLVRAISRKLR